MKGEKGSCDTSLRQVFFSFLTLGAVGAFLNFVVSCTFFCCDEKVRPHSLDSNVRDCTLLLVKTRNRNQTLTIVENSNCHHHLKPLSSHIASSRTTVRTNGSCRPTVTCCLCHTVPSEAATTICRSCLCLASLIILLHYKNRCLLTNCTPLKLPFGPLRR